MADPTFQIPREVIEPIVQAQVSAAVIAALGSQADLIASAVGRVLNQKVDSEGKSGGYGADTSWVQWMMNNCLRKACQKAIEEAMTVHQEKVRAAIVSQLTGARSKLLNELATSMVRGASAAVNSKWNFHVTLDGGK